MQPAQQSEGRDNRGCEVIKRTGPHPRRFQSKKCMRGWRPAPDTEISISKSRDVRRFNMELSRNVCEATAGLAIPYYYCSFSFQPFTTLVYKM